MSRTSPTDRLSPYPAKARRLPDATAAGRSLPVERLLALGLALGCVAYWAAQWQPFVLPNNDYYSFERLAREIASGSFPSSFKRMPVFPALMALGAPFAPGPHPYLQAALAWNMALSAGQLLLLHWMAERWIGRGAIVATALLAANVQFHVMALDALVEPTLGFFVLLSFALLLARSRWQYAAAALAALCRYEIAALAAVLFLVNLAWERRFWRHALPAGLAVVPCFAWALGGVLTGGGGSGFYLELMEGMGFTPATDFLVRVVKEPFAGWYQSRLVPLFFVFLVAVPVPIAVGAVRAGRRSPRDAVALGAFLAITTGAVVAFGISKARYVYPGSWILLLWFAMGALHLAGWLRGVAAEWLPGALRLPAGAGAALALAAFGYRSLELLAREGHAVPFALDLAFAGVAVLVGAVGVARGVGRRPFAGAAALGALALIVPVQAGGIARKERIVFEMAQANASAAVLARWIERHMEPDETLLTLHSSQVRFLAPGVRSAQLRSYGSLRAETLEELAREMRAEGIEYAAYTWRKPVQTPSDAVYYRDLKTWLAEQFAFDRPLPGFEPVATLEVPVAFDRPPVRIYRLEP